MGTLLHRAAAWKCNGARKETERREDHEIGGKMLWEFPGNVSSGLQSLDPGEKL